MAYEKLNWQNGNPPALNAANLNHMEDGIVGAFAAAEEAKKAGLNMVTITNNFLINNVNVDYDLPMSIPDDCKLLGVRALPGQIQLFEYNKNNAQPSAYGMFVGPSSVQASFSSDSLTIEGYGILFHSDKVKMTQAVVMEVSSNGSVAIRARTNAQIGVYAFM